MNNLIENEELNKKNKRNFRFFTNESFNCVLCGCKCYLNESYSNKGDRLICHTCYYNKFDTSTDARRWIDRYEKYDI